MAETTSDPMSDPTSDLTSENRIFFVCLLKIKKQPSKNTLYLIILKNIDWRWFYDGNNIRSNVGSDVGSDVGKSDFLCMSAKN